jgi:hypothetical protein
MPLLAYQDRAKLISAVRKGFEQSVFVFNEALRTSSDSSSRGFLSIS